MVIDPRKLERIVSEIHVANSGVGKPLWMAMSALLQAAVYAQDVQHDVWDFSLELRELREYGLNASDIRWLICKGYVDQAEETRNRNTRSRSFEKINSLCILQKSCFVLTNLGVQTAIQWNCDALFEKIYPSRESQASRSHAPQDQNGRKGQEVIIPKWNSEKRMVTYNGMVVKQFKLPSPNQVAILAAFEEEGWPSRIDDPLPPRSNVDPKQRLHDTIRSINRNQRHKLLFFRGDGTGNGITWMPRDGSSSYEDEEITAIE